MTPISLCVLSGTKVVLRAHFPLLAPTSSPLVQSGSKLWPKSVNGSLAPQDMGQPRLNCSSSVNSPLPVVVTVALAGSVGTEIVLMLDTAASPERPANKGVLCALLLGLELLDSCYLSSQGLCISHQFWEIPSTLPTICLLLNLAIIFFYCLQPKPTMSRGTNNDWTLILAGPMLDALTPAVMGFPPNLMRLELLFAF